VFAVAIHQQLEMVGSDPSPTRLAEKTIEYANAKTAYFKALREEVPELTNIATGREARPPELDKFVTAFALAGEKQEMVANQKTVVLLNDSQAMLRLRRRGRNSSGSKKPKSNSIRSLTVKTSPAGRKEVALKVALGCCRMWFRKNNATATA
jgi:hypothetical protein